MSLLYIGVYLIFLINDCMSYCFNYELREAAPKCIELLLPSGARIIDVVKRPIPDIDRFQLKQMCRQIDKFESCFQDVVDLCDSSQKRIHVLFKSMRASFRYLCESGLEAFSSSASCLNGEQVKQYLDECSEHSKAGIAKVPHSAHAISDEKHDVCHLINELIACATNVALTNCGQSAENLTERIYRKHLNAIYNEWGCSYLSEEDILGITVAGAVVISVAIAISIYCCRRRTMVEPLPNTAISPTSSGNSREFANRSVVQLGKMSDSDYKKNNSKNPNQIEFDDGFGSLGLRRYARQNIPDFLKVGTNQGPGVARDQ